MARAAGDTVERRSGRGRALDEGAGADAAGRGGGAGEGARLLGGPEADRARPPASAGRRDLRRDRRRAACARPGARVGAPVVCVGNFVAGGAGKTPTAIALARMLIGDGRRVAFLSRGYGGARRAEPLRVDPALHTARDRRRRAAAARPASRRAGSAPIASREREARGRGGRRRPGARRRPAESGARQGPRRRGGRRRAGFGNGLCIPAGPLRAPLAAQAPFVRRPGRDRRRRRPAARRSPPPRPAGRASRASLEPDAVAAARADRPGGASPSPASRGRTSSTPRCGGSARRSSRAATFPTITRSRPREIEALVEEATRRRAILVTTEKDPRPARPVRPRRRGAAGDVAVRGACEDEGDAAAGVWLNALRDPARSLRWHRAPRRRKDTPPPPGEGRRSGRGCPFASEPSRLYIVSMSEATSAQSEWRVRLGRHFRPRRLHVALYTVDVPAQAAQMLEDGSFRAARHEGSFTSRPTDGRRPDLSNPEYQARLRRHAGSAWPPRSKAAKVRVRVPV